MFRTNCAKIFSVPDWSDTTTKTYDLSTVSGREQVPINIDEVKGVCFIYVRENNEYYRLISDTTSGTTRTLVFNGSKKITITVNGSVMTVEFGAGADVVGVTDTTLTLSGVPADAKATGDAISEINNTLDEIVDIDTGYTLDVSTVEYVQGYLNSNGTITPTTGTNAQKTTVPIPLNPGDYTVTFSGMNVNTSVTHIRAVAVYNSNDECTNYYQVAGLHNFTVEPTDSYVRFNAQYTSLTEYTLESDEADTVIIKSNVVIPTDSTLNENKPANAKAVGDAINAIKIPTVWYMPYRRPLIAFTFDGDYNKNSAFKALFDEHNKKCGFAIPYTNTFPYNSKETYLSWETNGFEILGHSAVAIGTQSSLTDEEIRQIVQATYSTLVGYGFNIHGFVSYQGNSKQVAITEAQRIYDYAMTMPNHAGDLTGDRAGANIYFAVDQPYNLWRYSMQNSTLQQMKDAVDTCYTTNGLILFYGHANNSALANMTLENVDALLTYIETKGVPIVTPYEAIKNYYTVRPQDFVQTQNVSSNATLSETQSTNNETLNETQDISSSTPLSEG